MTLAPIVLFTYNRPLHTKQTLEALAANNLARESELYIYSDAPKNPEAKAAVTAVRSYLKTVSGFKRIEIIEREHNLGLADSIVTGVTKAVEQYGKVIVLEDDLVTAPDFLTYMNDALTLYEKDEQVMHISGYFFPIDTDELTPTFFYNQTSCWGWATWKRAWKHYRSDASVLLNEIKASGRLTEFDMGGNFKFSSTLKANSRGDIKTWAIKWHASVFLKHGLCLHPAQSLIFNAGHDGSGVNSNQSSHYDTTFSNASLLPLQKIKLQESAPARELATQFLRSTRPNLIQKVTQRLKLLKKRWL